MKAAPSSAQEAPDSLRSVPAEPMVWHALRICAQGQTEQLQTLLLQEATNRQVAVAQQRVWQVALEVHGGKQPAISCAPFIGLLKSSAAGAS
jgi:hypothetical protein